MSLIFSTDRTEFEGKVLNGAIAELTNAVIALFWEGDDPRLGTLTATLPSKVSSALLGDRYSALGQLVGEQLSAKYGKMILTSTYLSAMTESSAAKAILEMTKRISTK